MYTYAKIPKAGRQAASSKTTPAPRTYFEHRDKINSILHLQRAIGNQAVKRRLEADTGDVKGDAAASEIVRFGHDLSKMRVLDDSRAAASARVTPPGQSGVSTAPPDHGTADRAPVQAKLNISAPGDIYEKEADGVAEEVVRLPGAVERVGRLQRGCACGIDEETEALQRSSMKRPHISSLNQPAVARLRLSDLARSEPLQVPDEEIFPEEGGVIQSKSAPGPGLTGAADVGSAAVPADLASTIRRRCESSGEPLAAQTRAFMEPRFGRDFSRVRVHTDGPSGEIARQLNARAFTLGNHIFFSPGEYRFQHASGRKLLAHELTHAVQQGAGGCPARSKRIQRSEDHSLSHCPPYWRWETPRDAETFNCAGLSHRTYDIKSLAAARTALSAGRSVGCGSPCNLGDVKHWMWEFDTHVEDHTGRRLTRTSHDFHTVAGVTFGDPVPQDPTDVYSTDGRRPVHGPGPGSGFRPLAREQVKMNDASERLATDRAGNPVYWILYNYSPSCHCLPCPSSSGSQPAP